MRYVVGLGNYAMGDDGIGLRIVERIAERGLDRDFEAIEAANNGMLVLSLFVEETERILVADAVAFGGAPGEVRIFGPDDVVTQKQVGRISTHEGDLLRLLSMARELNLPRPDIRILAIQPAAMALGTGLSPLLEKHLDSYVEAAIAELRA